MGVAAFGVFIISANPLKLALPMPNGSDLLDLGFGVLVASLGVDKSSFTPVKLISAFSGVVLDTLGEALRLDLVFLEEARAAFGDKLLLLVADFGVFLLGDTLLALPTNLSVCFGVDGLGFETDVDLREERLLLADFGVSMIGVTVSIMGVCCFGVVLGLFDGVERLGDFVTGVVLGLFAGDDCLGDFFTDFGVFFGLLAGVVCFTGVVDFPGLSSVIGKTEAAIDFLFNSDRAGNSADLNGSDNLLGVAPFLTGVLGGNVLSKCSGLSWGPNDTRVLFALGAIDSVDFLFLPPLVGVFFGVTKMKIGKDISPFINKNFIK